MRASWITGPLLALGVIALLPARAYAHHCHTAQHCVESGQPAWAWVIVFGTLAFTGASIAVDLTPFLGSARGLYGAIFGRDPLAQIYQGMTGLEAPGGTKLESWERAMGAIPMVGREGAIITKAVGKVPPRYVDEVIGYMKAMSPSLDVYGSGNTLIEAFDHLGTDTTEADQFKDGVTGPGNYPVRGGGEQLRADGIRQDNGYLQEAKHGGSPEHSPFVDDSDLPSSVRDKIRGQAEDEVYKHGRVVKDPDSPYQGLEYITNDEGAKRFYEDLFDKHGVPGHVRVEE